MALRIFPTLISGGTGVVHGLARRNDTAQGRANPDGSAVNGRWPLALAVEAVAFAGGIAADMMRFTPDITEPMIYGGATLLGDRGGHAIGATVGAGRLAAVPYYAPVGPGSPAYAYRAAPAVVREEERPTVLG